MRSYNKYTTGVFNVLSIPIKRNITSIKLSQPKCDDLRFVYIDDKKVLNLNSYSYMGLEKNPEIKKAMKDAVEMYGSQFGASRAYYSSDLYVELESTLKKMFGVHCLVVQNQTLAHQALLPVIINEGDLIVQDIQVHASVQNASLQSKAKGIKTRLIKHNDIESLEKILIRNKGTKHCVWYFIDGVYSMFGDFAPVDELKRLLKKYSFFRLYIDDAHGVSWYGANGSGWALDNFGCSDQVIISTSLNKSFAGIGGVILSHDEDLIEKIKVCGPPMIFTSPQPPAMIAASLASAKLHLENDFEKKQLIFKEKIIYANKLVKELQLPIAAMNETPIFFIKTSVPLVSYLISEDLLGKNLLVGISVFPAVPAHQSGLRVCLTNHLEKEDIRNALTELKRSFDKVLEQLNYTYEDIENMFSNKFADDMSVYKPDLLDGCEVIFANSIKQINELEWNECFLGKGVFDYKGMCFLEATFKNRQERHENWKFFYYLIKDVKNNEVVAATFFTESISKDDLFLNEKISKNVESIRDSEASPYKYTSKIIMMGSLLTEGSHLFINEKYDKSFFLGYLINESQRLMKFYRADGIVLRDFSQSETSFYDESFVEKGFIKFKLPNTNHIDLEKIRDEDHYLSNLNNKSRKRYKKVFMRTREAFNFKKNETITDEETIDLVYELYVNMKKRAMKINTFDLSRDVLSQMCYSLSWDKFLVYQEDEIVGFWMSYSSGDTYIPLILGMNYEVLFSVKESLYKFIMYNAVREASGRNHQSALMGMSNDKVKSYLGAESQEVYSYISYSDTYKFEQLELYN